ncbi:MAG: 30S ribosomal protein S27ae [Thaumarchaeota archaeon]|mgnify:CR=1 FL=1|nr:30S ribosomal protein S27ae [Nitrososphaerota archaeon]
MIEEEATTEVEEVPEGEQVEEQVEEKPVSKPKGKRQKRKARFSPQIYKFYKVDDDKVTRLRKECPRCGKGNFLAEHSDRLSCGKCGYADFKKTKN